MKKLITLSLIACIFSSCASTNDSLVENSPAPYLTAETTAEINTFSPLNTQENAPFSTSAPDVTATTSPDTLLTLFDKNNFKLLYVIGSDVNVRSKPSVSGELLYQMKLNQTIKTFFEKDGWYYVEYSENHYGYMLGKYLSETPSSQATPALAMSRDEALNYNYRTIPSHLVNEEATTTYEIIESKNGKILVYEAKLSQITEKIKEKDAKIGAMVESLVAKWIGFVPNTTRTYMSLVEEFEPDQGTLFQITCISVEANAYKELLDYLENVFLMMIGFEGYVDQNIDIAKESKEYYENEFSAIYDNIERLGSVAVTEALHNADGYAVQSQKVADWYALWNDELSEFFDLKWKILAELDFSKNQKSYDFYKAYDKYEIYNSYNNNLRDILRIMHGEKSYWDE